MKMNSKRWLSLLLTLAMVIGMLPVTVFAKDDDTVYLAFSSDVHTHGTNASSRVSEWLENVTDAASITSFKYMSFCGDHASAQHNLSESGYWESVQNVMDAVEESRVVGTGIYINGNHEHLNGNVNDTSNATAKKISENGKVFEENGYALYVFGAESSTQEFTTDKINTLDAQLDSWEEDGDIKTVFILSHFPIHSYGGRSTKNAASMISTLNKYAGALDIYFLWGHNHTNSDPNYDKVHTETIDTTAIDFTYLAAGCMSDSEYSPGSQSVKGKGLVSKLVDGKVKSLTYYDADGDVTLSYTVTETMETPTKVNTLNSGKYIIVADGMALTSVANNGYTNGNGYSYSGFDGAEVTISGDEITSTIEDDYVWELESAGDGGFYVKHAESGKYLCATYEGNGRGSTGTLYLSDSEKDTWTWDNSQEFVSEKSKKQLTWDNNVSNITSGNDDFFGIRTTGDAISFYTVDYTPSDEGGNEGGGDTGEGGGNEGGGDTTEPGDTPVISGQPTLANSLTNGYYIIVAENQTEYANNSYGGTEYDQALTSAAHTGYTNTNNYGYSGFEADHVTISNNKITDGAVGDMVWEIEASGSGYTIKHVASGKYLSATYTPNSSDAKDGKLFLDDSADVWTWDGDKKLTSANSTKSLTFDQEHDNNKDKIQSGNANLFTVRTTGDAISFYSCTLSGDGGNEGGGDTGEGGGNEGGGDTGEGGGNEGGGDTTEPGDTPVISGQPTLANRLSNGYYIIVAENQTEYANNSYGGTEYDQALTSDTHNGYTNTQSYSYSGLDADHVTISGSKITDGAVGDMVWEIEASGSGYTIKHVASGKYLSATYKNNNSDAKDGKLFLDNSADVWTWDGNKKLTSANSTKSLTFDQEHDNTKDTIQSGNANLFTVRTTGDAISFYTCTLSGDGGNEGGEQHTHTLTKTDATEATCTEDGNSAYWSCQCGMYFSDAEGKNEIQEDAWIIEATGHSIVRYAAKAATCTEIGWAAYERCSNCDYTTYAEIPATGHNFGDSQPTCSVCNAVNPDYEAPEVPATDVSLSKNTLTLAKDTTATLTATVTPGNTTDSLVWSSTNTVVATVDNGTITALAVGETIITVTAGTATDSCVVTVVDCIHTEQAVDAVEGDCVTPGHAAYTKCTKCGAILNGSDAPVYGDHGETEIRNRKDATPTEDGYTGDTYCTVCDELLEEGEPIPATGVVESAEVLLTVSDIRARAGTTDVTATVSVEDLPADGLGKLVLEIAYDDTVLKLTGVKDLGALGEFTEGRLDANPYIATWTNARARSTGNEVLELTFDVLKVEQLDANAELLSVSARECADASGEDLSCEVENPEVDVTIPGDANRDGYVSGKDLLVLRQYLVEMDVTIDESAADVNGDGYVSGKDVILMRQYLAEWDVELQ